MLNSFCSISYMKPFAVHARRGAEGGGGSPCPTASANKTSQQAPSRLVFQLRYRNASPPTEDFVVTLSRATAARHSSGARNGAAFCTATLTTHAQLRGQEGWCTPWRKEYIGSILKLLVQHPDSPKARSW